MKKIGITRRAGALLAALSIGILLTAALPIAVLAQDTPLRILCSTFPIYQITRNVSQGRPAAQVGLMLPAQLGCPHDYALTPRDMQLLAQADVLVINGLGLEEFLGPQVKAANPRLTVVDSSRGVDEVMNYHEGEELRPEADGHEHHGPNPHLFTSPRLVAKLAGYIAGELGRLDPAGADTYRRNAEAYGQKMASLDQRVHMVGKRLVKRRIITQHGVFDYLARDLGLEVVAVVEAHPGQEPSAAEMLALIKTAKDSQAGAIFAEPQYPAKVVQTIAKEAGIPAASLDPAASGPDTAGLDYFEVVMNRNLDTLQATLGSL